MEIILAKTAGFCFGVRRAVKTAENAAMLPGKCMTLGPIIHNRSVTEKLHGMGVSEISSVAEAHEGDTVIIRSHGVGPEYYRQLEERKANIIDATCPDVKKIHNIAKREYD